MPVTERELPVPRSKGPLLQRVFYVNEEYEELLRFWAKFAVKNGRPGQSILEEHTETYKWVIAHNVPLLRENECVICLVYEDKSREAISKTPDPGRFRLWIPKKQDDFNEIENILVNTKGFLETQSIDGISDIETKKLFLRMSEIAFIFDLSKNGKEIIK